MTFKLFLMTLLLGNFQSQVIGGQGDKSKEIAFILS